MQSPQRVQGGVRAIDTIETRHVRCTVVPSRGRSAEAVMAEARMDEAAGPFDVNAQRGQNRAGVEVDDGESFDDYEGARPIDPHAADERLDDEGPEIRARKHDLGHDVVDPREPGEGDGG